MTIEKEPKSYLIFSILNTVFCCFFVGIGAIIYSVKSREAKKYGDLEKASKNSKIAKTLNIIGLLTGLAVLFVYSVILICYLIIFYFFLNSDMNYSTANATTIRPSF